jgi:hypothetical protein
MPNKGRVMNRGATKRERPWPEQPGTPHKFRAGIGGPGCICCRVRGGHKPGMKRLRRHSMRSKEKAELRKSQEA